MAVKSVSIRIEEEMLAKLGYVAVDTPALIIRHITQLRQHFLFNSDRYAFDCHKHTSLDILCVYFIFIVCYNV